MRSRRLAWVVVLALAAPASAQDIDFEKVVIRTEPVAPGLSVLFGQGGNRRSDAWQ